jgi:hypothetical protein
MFLMILLSCYKNLGIFGALVFKLWILFTTARTFCHYVCMFISSSNMRLYCCTHGYPILNHVLFLSWTEFILVHLHPSDSHFCRYAQMDNIGSASADVETWTLVNCFEEVDFLRSCGTPWRTLGTPLTQSTRHVRSWPQASSFVVKWRWTSPCARPILLAKSGRVRHKDWTWLTLCRRLLLKRSQLFVGSTLTW